MNWHAGQNETSLMPIRIEAIVDTICPWCYIGKKRLEKALSREQLDNLIINWRPFLLNPDMPNGGIDRKLYLSAKFGGTESATRVYKAIETAGAAVGIEFKFDDIKITPDSTDSHRLIFKVCSERPAVGNALVEDLFVAYFLEGQNIGDLDILAEIAVTHGEDRNEILDYLAGDMDRDFVGQENRVAHQMGVTGVPCFVFNGRHALSGAQEPEILQRMVRLARQEETPAS
ncbi:MAG TPA: DsbA family oxidoreductase [Thalassospira lucentensis]|uniref:DsbA family oxidoreductase n=3 Tax=Thalassospira lucentensis TaxID=168935 RepID=A0A3D5N7P4_9PROT|nr:DsbA family oxidoreductase [Thalassospira lucentensis]HCW67475.1 DsbA family oxidoreductase [Thalassospira lucentensis]